MLSSSEPLFTPLGVSQHRGEMWFHIRVRGMDRRYRPTQALGLQFLLALRPDLEHWRVMYPSQLGGKKVDALRACAAIQRMCIEAGEYLPTDAVL